MGVFHGQNGRKMYFYGLKFLRFFWINILNYLKKKDGKDSIMNSKYIH
jgi:hypothetical protein